MSGRKPRVFMTTRDVCKESLDLLQKKCELVFCAEEYPSKEEVYKAVQGVDALFWYWIKSTVIDKELLDAAGPNLKVVATMSSGYEHLDVLEMRARGIKMSYNPHTSSAAVAEMAVTLLLSVLHRVQEARVRIATNKWTPFPKSLMTKEVSDSTVGIVGLGAIGQAVARRLRAFEPDRILYCGPSEKLEAEETGAEYVKFEELLKQSDFIIISCRLNDRTNLMFDEAAFNKMKPSATLVNVSRGEIVDQEALILALQDGKIWGAGLDVMNPEPLPKDSPLLSFYNCVMTPHVGSSTVKTRHNMAILTAENILAALEDKPMPSPLW